MSIVTFSLLFDFNTCTCNMPWRNKYANQFRKTDIYECAQLCADPDENPDLVNLKVRCVDFSDI